MTHSRDTVLLLVRCVDERDLSTCFERFHHIHPLRTAFGHLWHSNTTVVDGGNYTPELFQFHRRCLLLVGFQIEVTFILRRLWAFPFLLCFSLSELEPIHSLGKLNLHSRRKIDCDSAGQGEGFEQLHWCVV